MLRDMTDMMGLVPGLRVRMKDNLHMPYENHSGLEGVIEKVNDAPSGWYVRIRLPGYWNGNEERGRIGWVKEQSWLHFPSEIDEVVSNTCAECETWANPGDYLCIECRSKCA